MRSIHTLFCFICTRRRAMIKRVVAASPASARETLTPRLTVAPRLSLWLCSSDSLLESREGRPLLILLVLVLLRCYLLM